MSSPIDAKTRRLERRETARVLLIDPDHHVLLFEDSDPGLPERPTFWITPGGALDPGETAEDAALREVAEETGHELESASLAGPVARREVVHGYSDKVVEQTETYFVAKVPRFEVDTTGLTLDEQLSMQGHHWWSIDELRGTDATVWPRGLVDLVTAVLDGASFPVPIDGAEESTVPADAGRDPS
jgi:8-oxo-dGTP pyrophosphatase MutT (NUDIX family)